MNNSVVELTQYEQEFLDERGFLIKEPITNKTKYIFSKIYSGILKGFLLSSGLFALLAFIMEVFFDRNATQETIIMNGGIALFALFLCFPIVGFFRGLSDLMKYKYMYMTHREILCGGKMYVSGSAELGIFLKKMERNGRYPFFGLSIIIVPILTVIFVCTYGMVQSNIFITILSESKYFFIVCAEVIAFIGPLLYCYFFIKNLQIYFLNRFLSLGLRLQKITPKIQLIGQKFQCNFQEKTKSGTGFGLLREYINELSKGFLEITKIILSLERLEKRMTRGDIFDIIKYIHSLKEDIIIPITNIRDLLLEQREGLLFQERERQKLSSEEYPLIAHTEFQSVRSSNIRGELDVNIEKLNMMIAKFEGALKNTMNSCVKNDPLNTMIAKLN